MRLPQPDASAIAADRTPEAGRLHLDFLDGLRGLAALYVVLHHAYAEIDPGFDGAGMPLPTQMICRPLLYGHVAVAIFIVLSGYCLMMPVSRAADGRLRGGFRGYIKRRARRILPPYYAMLAICLFVLVPVMALPHPNDPRWNVSRDDFAPPVLLSHLFLVHNLSDRWIYRIDNPMWSVATEWQIYLVFPLLLLPIWRRTGAAVATVLAFVIGYLPSYLWHGAVDRACFWYLGLFALGMAGAEICFAQRVGAKWWFHRLPWGILGLSFTLLSVWKLTVDWTDTWNSDPLIGLATVCLMIYCARQSLSDNVARHRLAYRMLDSDFAVMLGMFSYSIYLVHYPVLALLHMTLVGRDLPNYIQLTLMLALAVPIALIVSYGFHLLVERRFMPGQPQTPRAVITSATESPAP